MISELALQHKGLNWLRVQQAGLAGICSCSPVRVPSLLLPWDELCSVYSLHEAFTHFLFFNLKCRSCIAMHCC